MVSNYIGSSLCLGISRTGALRCFILGKICRTFSYVKNICRKGFSYNLLYS